MVDVFDRNRSRENGNLRPATWDEALDRIVEGKLGKFFEENCLYEQHFIKDPAGTLTVRELITSKIAKFGENITVRRYSRFKVGEGIGKTASESAPPGEVAQ